MTEQDRKFGKIMFPIWFVVLIVWALILCYVGAQINVSTDLGWFFIHVLVFIVCTMFIIGSFIGEVKERKKEADQEVK